MMTKREVLQLNEPSDIWEEMQKNPELKKDGEVWLHMTRLSAKKDREWSEKTYGDPDAYLYMDLNKKK